MLVRRTRSNSYRGEAYFKAGNENEEQKRVAHIHGIALRRQRTHYTIHRRANDNSRNRIIQKATPEKWPAGILRQTRPPYDNLFEISVPYTMGFHQTPIDSEIHPEWHFHAHFYPPLLRSATVRN
jgi:hypothetical protein